MCASAFVVRVDGAKECLERGGREALSGSLGFAIVSRKDCCGSGSCSGDGGFGKLHGWPESKENT
jgi:hypothetical protein